MLSVGGFTAPAVVTVVVPPRGPKAGANRVAALVLGAAEVLSNRSEDQSDQANGIRIGRVLRCMGGNPGENATAEDFARIAGLSVAAFHVHFKRITGTSPKDHWLRLKIEHAAMRLRSASQPTITEVGP